MWPISTPSSWNFENKDYFTVSILTILHYKSPYTFVKYFLMVRKNGKLWLETVLGESFRFFPGKTKREARHW